MNYEKIGQLIRQLRTEKGLTQEALAEMLHVSNKTISKWECGNGCPEVSLFPALSTALEVDFSALFSGNLEEKQKNSGNFKHLKFYICPNCGNIIAAVAPTSVSCCGKMLQPLTAQKAEGEALNVEWIENEYFISSQHEMTRDHYITCVGLLSSDQLLLRKLYPEWDLQVRMPPLVGAHLIWHCSRHGLFYQLLPRPVRQPRNR